MNRPDQGVGTRRDGRGTGDEKRRHYEKNGRSLAESEGGEVRAGQAAESRSRASLIAPQDRQMRPWTPMGSLEMSVPQE